MSGKKQLQKWAGLFTELLFPPRCSSCGVTAEQVSSCLCSTCFSKIPYVCSPLCVVCGKNFLATQTTDHICGQCIHQTPPFTMARAVTYYEEPVRTLLHKLKYSFDTSTVEPLLKIVQGFDFSAFESCDVFVPVPLFPVKLKQRGLNQALLLAKIFFPCKSERIFADVLVKSRQTASQTELDRLGRRKNLKRAFDVKRPEIIKNKKVCLVDDIYTTGTTVTECAITLVRAGAAEVMVLTLMRVREMK